MGGFRPPAGRPCATARRHGRTGVIWDGVALELAGRASRVQGLAQEVDALRMILLVNQRASFEFVVTEASRVRSWVGAALAWSIERRRHQATARHTHYQQQRRTLH
jgi:hypothetical protein